jgi:hypothetical protein
VCEYIEEYAKIMVNGKFVWNKRQEGLKITWKIRGSL